jgi:hypothetical protein
MNNFEKFCYTEIYEALAAIDTRITPDIYVLSFHIFDLDDDSRRPVLQLGYNTRARLAECTPAIDQAPGWPIASSTQEAKWNFAFWLQNQLKFIGEPENEGGQLLEATLKSRGLWYSDEEEEADFDRCEKIASEITAYFVDTCVRIAQALHACGVIEQQFSGPVPIVVHELEYYDQIASQTRLANPPGLAKEFEDWIASM